MKKPRHKILRRLTDDEIEIYESDKELFKQTIENQIKQEQELEKISEESNTSEKQENQKETTETISKLEKTTKIVEKRKKKKKKRKNKMNGSEKHLQLTQFIKERG